MYSLLRVTFITRGGEDMFSTDPKMFDWLVEVRRYFHMHPEISHQEYGTTKKIAAILKSIGLDVLLYDDMTGAVGTIKGATGEKTLGLRAEDLHKG